MNNGVISDTNTGAENSGARGITVGKNTQKISEYIRHQQEDAAASEQLRPDISDPFTGSPYRIGRTISNNTPFRRGR